MALYRAGKPTQHAFAESLNGRMRDELLNETLFLNLDHARQKLISWAADYNACRPHSAISYQTPAAYAAHLTASRGITNAETLGFTG